MTRVRASPLRGAAEPNWASGNAMRWGGAYRGQPGNPGISEKYLGNFALFGKKTRVASAEVPRSAKIPR